MKRDVSGETTNGTLLQTIRRLWPYIWPADRPDLKSRVSLAMVLRDEGHEVMEVYRGDSVLPLTSTFRPEVLILDIGMPGLTGFEILVSFLQAFIFTILAAVYIGGAMHPEH